MEQQRRRRSVDMQASRSETEAEYNGAESGVIRALHLTIRRKRSEIALVLLALCVICVLLRPSDISLPFRPNLFPSPSPLDLDRTQLATEPLQISMFDIPDHISADLSRCEDICTRKNHGNKGIGNGVNDSEAIAASYGSSFSRSIQHQPKWPFRILDTDQFAFERIFTHEIRRRFNTSAEPQDDAGADFIYIPLETRAIARCFGSCGPLSGPNHEFDRHALRRTVVEWLVKTVESLADRRSYPSIILALSLIRHDYEGNILNNVAMKAMQDDVVVLGIEGETWTTVEKLKHFRQVPYPSWLHAESPSTAVGEWQLSRKREILLVFAGKNAPSHPMGGKGPHNGYAIRHALTEQLLAEPADDIFLKTMDSGSKKEDISAIHEALASSIFAITPPGDSGTRKGFFDALLLGSIPVIFRPGTYSNVFPALRLEDLAVVIPEQEIIDGASVVERLRAVSRDEIRKKQVGIARIAHLMQYSLPSQGGETGKEDATAAILRDLVALRDSSL